MGIERFLAHGTDPNLRDECDKIALHYAAEFDNVAVMERLLAHGIDPNLRDEFDKIALHYAAENYNAKAVEILLDCGAEVNTRDMGLKAQLRKMRIPTFSTEKIRAKRKRKSK